VLWLVEQLLLCLLLLWSRLSSCNTQRFRASRLWQSSRKVPTCLNLRSYQGSSIPSNSTGWRDWSRSFWVLHRVAPWLCRL